MSDPVLEVLSKAAIAAEKDARDSDLAALRTMYRHLLILADDYQYASLDTWHELKHAANRVELAINALVAFRKEDEGELQ